MCVDLVGRWSVEESTPCCRGDVAASQSLRSYAYLSERGPAQCEPATRRVSTSKPVRDQGRNRLEALTTRTTKPTTHGLTTHTTRAHEHDEGGADEDDDDDTAHPPPNYRKLSHNKNRANTTNQQNSKQCSSGSLHVSEPHFLFQHRKGAHFI